MPSRLHSRLKRLEAQSQACEGPQGQGLAALLVCARRDSPAEDRMPLEVLSDAELDANIAALTGQRGFAICLRELLEEERARRQVVSSV